MNENPQDAQYNHPKIDLYPVEFNELRRVLSADFPMLWSLVGGMMVHSHELLIPYMNTALDTQVDVSRHTLAQGCVIWLSALDNLKYEARTGIIIPQSIN